MYIPKNFSVADRNEMIAFMKQYSFATIVTAPNNIPIATHLPFVLSKTGEDIILISHFAKANPQWKHLVANQVLVIFVEPHAYISPRHYDKVLNVPTWNYIAVHAYGRGKLITDMERTMDILERTIDNYESEYRLQWDQLPDDYKKKMANGIVAFEIAVTEIQAAKKLSQNKNDTEQKRIMDTLSKSDRINERDIAKYMQQGSLHTGEKPGH